MSTYMPKGSTVDRDWYVIDAAGRSLGHVATEVATLLRGKHKPTFAPHHDGGDHVVVINAEKVVLTGKKLEQKQYHRHTGYIGNLKSVTYGELMKKRPEFVIEKAVKGMIPRNTLGRLAMTRLRVYRDGDHKQTAQMPKEWKY